MALWDIEFDTIAHSRMKYNTSYGICNLYRETPFTSLALSASLQWYQMSVMVFEISGNSIICATTCSGLQQRITLKLHTTAP